MTLTALPATATPPPPVLIVDDQPMQRTLLRRALGRLGHEVFEATSGEQALELIDQHQIQLIVSDWVMEGMDGVELCRRLRGRDDETHYAYFILMSSRDTRDDLIAGIRAGADDFLRKPIDVDELAVRLRSGQRVLDLQAGLSRRNRQLRQVYERVQRDIDAAGVFQQSLLPTDGAGDDAPVDLSWLFLPSNQVSGDALNHFRLDRDHLGFYVLDVAGHGVASAMVAMIVTQYLNPRLSGCLYRQAQLDTRQLVINDPADAMRALNDQLLRQGHGQGIGSSYLTCLYGVLDLRDGRVRLVRAGHTLPLIGHADGRVEVIDDEGDFPLGLIEDTTFHVIERTLAPGARLCLYSDGITECENPGRDGEQFGLERLRGYLAATARAGRSVAQVTTRFADVMREWAGPASKSFADDLSMLLIEYRGEGHACLPAPPPLPLSEPVSGE